MGLISLAEANIRQEEEFFLKGMTSYTCVSFFLFFSLNFGDPPSIPMKKELK